MAKINARGHRKIGPTLFTEKVRPAGAYDVETTYYEAWRVRSDGDVQTRIIRTTPTGDEGREVEHRSSAFRSVGQYKTPPTTYREANETLRLLLERRGYTVVKEKF